MIEKYFELGIKTFSWIPPTLFFILLFFLAVWTLIWKGIALWKSARKGDRSWFIALLLINTFGVLEILYIYVFSKKPKPPEVSD